MNKNELSTELSKDLNNENDDRENYNSLNEINIGNVDECSFINKRILIEYDDYNKQLMKHKIKNCYFCFYAKLLLLLTSGFLSHCLLINISRTNIDNNYRNKSILLTTGFIFYYMFYKYLFNNYYNL